MGSTNYERTFIRVAEDSPVTHAEVPVAGPNGPTVASLQYDIMTAHPYQLTSDDVLFAVHSVRYGIADEDRETARAAFFAKPQPCLRASPLTKRYGWGIHHDSEGHVALVGVGTTQYADFASDPNIRQLVAMRSKRA